MSTTVAALAIDALRKANIDTLYCLPGVQNDDFFNTLVDAHDITPVVTRHEQGASYLAMGAAQVTGKPAACCVVPGPGMLNAAGGLTSAYWGYARVLALVGQIHTSLMGRGTGTLHELADQTAILRQVTKHAVSVTDPADAPRQFQEALDALLSDVPRPVSVEVPVNNWGKPADGQLTSPTVSVPQPDPAIIERAAALLSSARNPLIVVGSGAWEAAPAVRALAEELQIPVTTRRMGHGVLPTQHELFVPLTVAHRMWPEVDVVLGIGSRLEWPLGTWGFDNELEVIQINVDPDELDRHGIGSVGILADATAACEALVAATDAVERPQLAATLDNHRAWFHEATAHIEPQRSYTAAIRQALPPEGVIVEDVTQIGFASHLWYDHMAPRSFLSSGAAGTLGAGTAVAIGASHATDRPVLGIVGDGGFLFTATELATAAQYQIPCNIVLFNNNAYGNVRRIQKLRFGADRTIASTLQNPHFGKLCDAFGVRHTLVGSPDALVPALQASIDHDGPCVTEVTVSEMPDPWPFLRMPVLRGARAGQ